MLEANLALVSVGQNEVVKEDLQLGGDHRRADLIASVYGMNFEDMPELKSPVGYPLSLLVMALAVAGLIRFFRRIDWI